VNDSTFRLTKSLLLSAYQCPKRLWLEINSPQLRDSDPSGEALARIGTEVGELARSLYPGGELIGHIADPEEAVSETEALLRQSGPVLLYEAAFQFGPYLVRLDILRRDECGRYSLIEVKASTSVKDEHLIDCAIQVEVLERCGLELDSIALAHIDSGFIYPGSENYVGLIIEQDITPETKALADVISSLCEEAETIPTYNQPPNLEMGEHCRKPYPCPFSSTCAVNRVEFPLSILPLGKKRQLELAHEGYDDIRYIPAGVLEDGRAEWIRQVTVRGEGDLKPEAKETLQNLKWPRYFLDFETIAPAIPIWAETRPFEAWPFQWSCHVETSGGLLEHQEFLADGNDNPSRACAESLLEGLGTEGPIFMYSPYERTIIKKLVLNFPDLEDGLAALLGRLVDLLPITRANYYHPEMRGSWSIKKVLPTLGVDLDYSKLEGISDGLGASEGFREMLSTPLSERKELLRRELLEYCRLDTLAMVELAKYLSQE